MFLRKTKGRLLRPKDEILMSDPRHGGAYWDFSETCAAESVFSQGITGYLSRTMSNVILQSAMSVFILWYNRAVSASASLACSHLCHEEEKQTTVTTDCWAAEVLNPARISKYSTCKTATINILISQIIIFSYIYKFSLHFCQINKGSSKLTNHRF